MLTEPRGFNQEQSRWLREHGQSIQKAFGENRDFMALKYLHAQPSVIFEGMIVLADGVNWNPGAGAGMYRRNEANAAWVFVG
jgi:hypothetical protein